MRSGGVFKSILTGGKGRKKKRRKKKKEEDKQAYTLDIPKHEKTI